MPGRERSRRFLRRRRQISTPAVVSLFCFPFAGGNAYSYRGLEACCPPELSLCCLELPGRGRRTREPLCRSLDALADDALAQLKTRLRGRYALFGHSMGAALAYLCALRIRDQGLLPPEALFLSGKAAPKFSSGGSRHLLPRPEFLRMLQDLGGCPPELMQEEGLIEYFEPILRADFQVVETWQPSAGEPLDIPLIVMRGEADSVSREQAMGWARETSGPFRLHEFDGGHFFIQHHWSRIASIIGQRLKPENSSQEFLFAPIGGCLQGKPG